MERSGEQKAVNEEARSQPSEGRPMVEVMRQSGIYALGNIALKASGLLIAPLYLNPELLSVDGFGYFALLYTTAQLAVFMVGLGLNQGLLKFTTDPQYADVQRAVPFTTLITGIGAAAIGFAVFWVLATPLADLLVDGVERRGLMLLVGGYVALKVIGGIPLMLLRARERAGWYATAITGEAIVLVGAVYYFLAVAELGLWGLMAAFATSAAVGTLVLVLFMLAAVSWKFDVRIVRPLVRFGWPLAVGALAAWFLNLGDRYLLAWLMDATVTGLYEWAARLAGAVNMLFVQSFQLAFSVIGLKALTGGDHEAELHRSTFRHYVVVTGWATLGITLLAYDLTRILTSETAYLQAEPLVLLLALGFMAYGIHFIITNVLYAAERTGTMGSLVFAAAVLNLVLNLALIPLIGPTGAAMATYAAYLALAVGNAYFARVESGVPFPWTTYLVVLVVIGLLYAAAWWSLTWATGPRLVLRGLLLVLYPALIIGAGVYSWAEVRRGWKWLVALRGGG